MPLHKGITCNRFIYNEQKQFPQATGEFSEILAQIVLAAKVVNREVNKAGLAKILGAAGETNVHGEEVQKLDVFSHAQFVRALSDNCHVAVIASEESEDLIHTNHQEFNRPGKYAVALDPLDGSSNIDVNVAIGTIWSIYRRLSEGPLSDASDLLQGGAKQLAAGYVLYGSSTMLVYTVGRGVHGFTLDPSLGEFFLSHQDIKMPPKGGLYSINEGNSSFWMPATRAWVEALKGSANPRGKPYSLRYIGSLVADFHRTLFRGGIFAYPSGRMDGGPSTGKLRYLYEAAPIAMIAENASGKASDGFRRILDAVPRSIHERTALFVGGAEDVEFAESFLRPPL